MAPPIARRLASIRGAAPPRQAGPRSMLSPRCVMPWSRPKRRPAFHHVMAPDESRCGGGYAFDQRQEFREGRRMAFSSWRGVVGIINPTMRPGVTEETIRLLPEGIGVIPLF